MSPGNAHPSLINPLPDVQESYEFSEQPGSYGTEIRRGAKYLKPLTEVFRQKWPARGNFPIWRFKADLASARSGARDVCAMEESERPTEFFEEQIHHRALHSKGDRTAWVAVTAAILATFAAVGSLLSSSRSNEAMMLQIQSSDQWSYYQEKRLKAALF
jgi:hypothetical protein